MARSANIDGKRNWSFVPNPSALINQAVALPPKLVSSYNGFVAKNASQVSQIESAMRSLTYIIPGRFRDAELASESIQSGVQLLSLYHDSILQNNTWMPPSSEASESNAPPRARMTKPLPNLHTRYTRHWTTKSALYRRVALTLQVVQYTQLLLEMAARRRGEKMRWRVVVLIEAVKALCRLLLMRVSGYRSVLGPALPEREVVAIEEEEADKDDGTMLKTLMGEEITEVGNGHALGNGVAVAAAAAQPQQALTTAGECYMPRTGLYLPPLPKGDVSSYLLSRVLTADDIKPATKLLPSLAGTSHNTNLNTNTDTKFDSDNTTTTNTNIFSTSTVTTAASMMTPALAGEVLYIITPLIYASLLAHFAQRNTTTSSTNSRSNKVTSPSNKWTPYLVSLSLTLLARHLATRRPSSSPSSPWASMHSQFLSPSPSPSAPSTQLHKQEWRRRTWAMAWWAMKSPMYEYALKGVVDGVKRRMPGLVGGIVDDYEYLWENYHFSTSTD